MAEIGVVIPAYIPTSAHQTWLGECVGSLLEQTLTNWEAVVVFDGRTDLDLDRRNGQIKVLAFEDKHGPGFARNAGVRVTSAPWLLFLDADDKLKPDALEKLYAARCEHGVVYGDLDWIGERTGHEQLFDWNPDHLRNFSGPCPITALHHRKAWQLVAGFAEHLPGLEDLEYWIRLAEQGICGRRIPSTILEYRQHGDSRQKQLTMTGQIHPVMREIRERHNQFFNGGHMGCSSCPGGQGGSSNPATPPQPQGTVALRYQGRRQGSFQTPPSPSGVRYLVDGIGAWVYANPADVDHLLMFNEAGGPMFQVMVQPSPVSAVPIIAAPKLFEKLELAPAIEDITGLNVKEATRIIESQTSITDLRVMAAMEKAGPNRTTVQTAITKRLKELAGEA